MTLVQPGWNWYVAQYVVEYRIVSHPDQLVRLVVLISTYLLYAESPDEAYSKTVDLSERIGNSYHNRNGDLITETCKGIHDLDNLQVKSLEDEECLAAFRLNDVTSEQIDALITPREHLSLFETDPVNNPNNDPDLCDS